MRLRFQARLSTIALRRRALPGGCLTTCLVTLCIPSRYIHVYRLSSGPRKIPRWRYTIVYEVLCDVKSSTLPSALPRCSSGRLDAVKSSTYLVTHGYRSVARFATWQRYRLVRRNVLYGVKCSPLAIVARCSTLQRCPFSASLPRSMSDRRFPSSSCPRSAVTHLPPHPRTRVPTYQLGHVRGQRDLTCYGCW